ncbi:hypothetical protein ACU4HD_44210 [Cupriavidus basilensis]
MVVSGGAGGANPLAPITSALGGLGSAAGGASNPLGPVSTLTAPVGNVGHHGRLRAWRRPAGPRRWRRSLARVGGLLGTVGTALGGTPR